MSSYAAVYACGIVFNLLALAPMVAVPNLRLRERPKRTLSWQEVSAPFRDLNTPMLQEVRSITERPDSLAVVIVPEFRVRRWRHQVLHNQKALFIKRLLLFEPRTILSSVPYKLR